MKNRPAGLFALPLLLAQIDLRQWPEELATIVIQGLNQWGLMEDLESY